MISRYGSLQGRSFCMADFKKELRMNEVYYMLNKALC